MSGASESSGPPLGKYLASTDKATRDKAIKGLTAFLSESENAEMAEKDMAKLWKGIFYCFWMSDKPLVQQGLATELANAMLNITSPSPALGFLEGFWRCIVREWSGIDRLRIDKYYMLIRRYVNASFRLLMREDWNSAWMEKYSMILTRQGGPLCPTDPRVPASMAYHLCDIYLEELDKVLTDASSGGEILPSAPLARLLEPFLTLASRTSAAQTLQRITSSVLGPLMESLEHPQYDESPDHKRRRVLDTDLSSLVNHSCLYDPTSEKQLDADTLRKGVAKLIFDIAGDSESRDSNRRKLYKFWKHHAPEMEEDSRTDAT